MQPHNPIDHVVIIVKENHAFDNYFGTFPGAIGATMPRSPNPPPHDPDHRHEAWLSRKTTAARQQFTEQDIPAYFAYARSFTLCDNYFTDVAGPSTPNHLMLITADSPLINNHAADYRGGPNQPKFNLPSLPLSLDKAGLTWRNYGGYAFSLIADLRNHPSNLFGPSGSKSSSDQFIKDAQTGKMPSVSWVYAPHELSEHPRDPQDTNPNVGNTTLGMQWTVDQINAIVKGGLWSKTAIFITWDDWGGWFDHVDPPNVEQWKNDGTPNAGTQFRYGSRVGCIVLSPYAKQGHVCRTLLSHVSLVKFCELTFGLQPLNARDRTADGMTDCFDFKQTPALPPAPSPGGTSPSPNPKPKPRPKPNAKPKIRGGRKPGAKQKTRKG